MLERIVALPRRRMDLIVDFRSLNLLATLPSAGSTPVMQSMRMNGALATLRDRHDSKAPLSPTRSMPFTPASGPY